MKKSEYSYIVVEDELEVCRQVQARMSRFPNWNCLGLVAIYEQALHIIKTGKPDLLFLDWSVRGGNAFGLLEEVNKMEHYRPYIIFFTGYQSDNPGIPEEIINKHTVNRYLVKPIWEKLTAHLDTYVREAEEFVGRDELKTYWIETIDKQRVKIVPDRIVCISQSRSNPRNKVIYYDDKQSFEIKSNWDTCEKLALRFGINYCFANTRDTLINKKHITKMQRPLVWLDNWLKIEVTKERWREVVRNDLRDDTIVDGL